MLPKNFNPEMLDENPNVFNLSFEAIFLHDYEVDCFKSQCRNPAHHRLLNPETGSEVSDNFSRIDAMREIWHNK